MKWILIVFLLLGCSDNNDDMKLFRDSLSNQGGTPTPPLVMPTGISYVGTRQTTGGSGSQTGHVQGFVIDEANDKIFISWTSGVSCFTWSTLAYQYRTPAISGGNPDHIGDIAQVGDFVYGSNAVDGFSGITPNTNKIYEWNKSDLSVNREVTSDFEWYLGGMAYDGSKLWGGYGGYLYDGKIQEVDIATLEIASSDPITIPNTSTPTDFGEGIQSLCFFPDNRILGFANYVTSPYANAGSVVQFANMETLDYDIYRRLQKPYDYGIFILGNKMYLIQKGGGTSDVNTDILEFNILY